MMRVESTKPTMGSSSGPGTRPCGHARHVGTCPDCQRTQLARWRAQLINAQQVGSAALATRSAAGTYGQRFGARACG